VQNSQVAQCLSHFREVLTSDLKSNQLIGEKGIGALTDKIVMVNHKRNNK